MHRVARKGNVEITKLLLQAATNLWAEDERGLTAFDYAMRGGHKEVFKLFAVTPGIQEVAWTRAMREIYKDTNIWAMDSRGKTYLDLAEESQNPGVIEELANARGTGSAAWIKAQLVEYKAARRRIEG